jgi:uncharacterized iron-regulated membrane protein
VTANSVRRWRVVHEWTSLICTLFLFVLCLTGLPLVFADEIAGSPATAPPPVTTSLDGIVGRASVRPAFLRIAPDEGRIYFGPAGGGRPLLSDGATGAPVDGGGPRATGIMDVVLALHGELLGGFAGRLFIGAMGLCALASVVSGIAIYAPFAGSRPFGDVRRSRARRLGWLDRHNVAGIAIAAWLLIVAGTGVMNAIEHPLFALWRARLPASLPPATGATRIGADAALALARRSAPDMRFETIVFPGPTPGIPGYYLVWGEGRTPLTAQLSAPVAIDAASGQVVGGGALPMPWFLRLLDLSRPLHFGDYGGLPLKLLWTLFDGLTLIVLGSGLYLWVARRLTRRSLATRDMRPHLEAAE